MNQGDSSEYDSENISSGSTETSSPESSTNPPPETKRTKPGAEVVRGSETGTPTGKEQKVEQDMKDGNCADVELDGKE